MKVFAIAAVLLLSQGISAHADEAATALLARARAASGGDAWDRVAALHASGEQTVSGLTGPWQSVEDTRTGRFVERAEFSVFRKAEGFDGSNRWRQDPSGGVHSLNSSYARQAAITESWLARHGWLRPDADGAQLGRVQTRTDKGRTFAVLEATPRYGQLVELWFSRPGALLARTVRVLPTDIQTVTFSDYRDVDGLKLPFSIKRSYQDPADDDLIQVSAYKTAATAVDTDFARPPPPDDATVPAAGTVIPLEIDPYPILEAKINGKGPFAFMLDTGGHDILTPEAAAALGLKPVGAGTSGGAGAGKLPLQFTRVERVDIGDAVLKDQHFYVLPFQYRVTERGTRAPLAGLIGIELFERFAVRMDYRAKTLTLRPLKNFHYNGKGVPVPLMFADDIPLINAKFNGIAGDFSIDTGNGGTLVVQHRWARKHGLAQRMKQGVEMVSFGVGGRSSNWASRGQFEVAGVTLRNVVSRYAEDQRGAFSSRTEAGNIGTEVLAHFTLDFDYANNTVWFDPVPGFVPTPFNRSGMQAPKDSPDAFIVAIVAPKTPAAEAGLRQGDRITAVDGVPAAQMSGRQMVHKLTQAPGTTVTLSVQRGGTERRHEVTLRELLPLSE